MNQLFRPEPPPKRIDEDEEPCYGWRYVKRKQPDGTEKLEEVPLTKEDLLYPEEGDHVVNDPVHTRDFIYCSNALTTFYKDEPSTVVLSDCRVDFGVAGIRPLGPDILVLHDVRQWLRKTTYQLAVDGGRPVLVLEIASPGTRDNDLGIKMRFYQRIGVLKYVVLDRGPNFDQPARLVGYERTRKGWREIKPDAQGRLSLAPVPLLLGIKDDHPRLYDATTGERLRDHAEAETKAREEEKARKKAEAKAKRAEARAKKEATARAELEKRLRELEEQLRRQRGQS